MGRVVRRLIACQGPSQLATALAVSSQRDTELSIISRSTLAIFDLYTSNEEATLFAGAMANLASLWDLDDIVFTHLESLRGLHFDEVFLARDWLDSNELLLDLFPGATKVCYGDGPGLFYSREFASPAGSSSRNYFSGTARGGTSAFDVGYALEGISFGAAPHFPLRAIQLESFAAVFERLMGHPAVSEAFDSLVRPDVLLLTSNCSEARRIDYNAEISAYEAYVKQHVDPSSQTLLKPHPREAVWKSERLAERLSISHPKVCVFTHPVVRFFPTEVVYLAITRRWPSARPPEVLSFGASHLLLSRLYGAKCRVGFGEELVRQHYFPDHVPVRVAYERAVTSVR